MKHLVEQKVAAFISKTQRPQINVAVWRDGELYQSSFGCAKREDVDVFEIGSIGKTFTATLLAILIDKGVVAIEDKIGRYYPKLSVLKDVTFKQLVTHSSGLPANPIKTICFSRSSLISNLLKFRKEDITDYLNDIKAPLKPGKFCYSNLGMALLGNTLAECLQMSYESAVQSYLLAPLGMTQTHVNETHYEPERVALGHSASGKVVPHFKWQGMEPAGVWRSTTSDMMQFLKAHLGCSGEQWQALLKTTTCPVFNTSELSHMGFAWVLEQRDGLGNIAWHNGGTFGQHSVVMLCKEQNMGIVILSNKSPRFWHGFFSSYSLEYLAASILKSLAK
ncbi:serine hydrolase domain-containing protein [Pseudoalteromonas sp. S16_S37]|uniref:serine hydrolase domain-containing protein n=1 Tax=Pseudoalteromonas sp. S16_S37 TaxID=2720228 RepID=UPI001680D3AF|nr:serine hydrolase domain-containing protein [Pseudoalteromonas sp. S16_S37]MBD1581621.1 beta-lactamase family protein [Pseudoalteromonas sp. S16_S37]